METLELKTREPTKEEIEEMEFYLRIGCVHQEYLNGVLGDISIGVNAFDKFHGIPKELRDLKEADWVVKMREFYNQNGYYRAEDLNRLLGSPIKGVEISEEGLRRSLGLN